MSTIAVKKVKLGDNADPSKNFLIEVPAVADGTLTIKREDGTNVLSIDANGKAVIPGVVGTVAQVGGVPTGQVVERGSNASGEYIRFADGTQICTSVFAANTLTNTAITQANTAGGYRTSQSTVPYGAAFVAVPIYVGCSYTNQAAGWWATAFSAGSSVSCQVNLRAINSVASPGDLSVNIFTVAIGRWF